MDHFIFMIIATSFCTAWRNYIGVSLPYGYLIKLNNLWITGLSSSKLRHVFLLNPSPSESMYVISTLFYPTTHANELYKGKEQIDVTQLLICIHFLVE